MGRPDRLQVEHPRPLGWKRVPVAAQEPADAVLEGLLGTAGDEQDPDPGNGPLGQELREPDEARYPGGVVVRPGHGGAARDVGHGREGHGPDDQAGAGGPAAAGDRRSHSSDRARQADPPERDRGAEAVHELGHELERLALEALIEDRTGLGGVVVREHDERAARIVRTDPRHHVRQVSLAPQAGAEQPRAVLDLVDEGDGARCRHRGPQPAPAEQRGAGAGERERSEREHGLRIRPVAGLALDVHPVDAGRGQARPEPLGCPPLALGARRAFDGAERIDDLAERRLRRSQGPCGDAHRSGLSSEDGKRSRIQAGPTSSRR